MSKKSQAANSGKGLFTDSDTTSFQVKEIPLSKPATPDLSKASTGQLVKAASAQVSSLVRDEVQLAKSELTLTAKRGAVGGVFFALALIIALYSTFFFFFFVAELLQQAGLFPWASYLIVFVVMIVVAVLCVFAGIHFLKKMEKPNETLSSLNDLKTVVPGQDSTPTDEGMYT